MRGNDWTEPRIEFLRRRWGEGATATTIAKELMGKFGLFFSPNAVIGKAHRLGLAGRPSPIKPRDPAATAGKRQLSGAAKRAAKRLSAEREAALRPAPMPAQQTAPAVVKPVARPIPAPIAKKASPFRTCQYLHGEAKLRNFCGAPTVPGHSYCGPHYIACHQKMEPVERPAESEAA